VYKVYLIIILLISGCANDCPPPEPQEFGDPYFELDCAWVEPGTTPQEAIWRCGSDIETPLLTGFIFLELEHADSLYFCGRDLILRSGIEIYDNLVRLITTGKYNCLHITEDIKKGNQFDWSWNNEDNILQLIWRPDDKPHKMITLIIEDANYDVIVKSTVYYKILSSN
jgi:hypothetical protein